MATHSKLDSLPVLREVRDAEGYIARICFKTGPPSLIGAELEWTVHDRTEPSRPVDRDRLRRALGRYAPATIRPADEAARAESLPSGGTVSVEPGGQVEISTAPQRSLGALHTATSADIDHLTALLNVADLVLGDSGIDPHRPPRPVVETPRYRAMRCVFDRRGAAGRTMMCSTAGLQICLDAGTPERLAARWAAAHSLGPVLIAAFATAGRHAGRDTGWSSARMASWLNIDPTRTRPVWSPVATARDPVTLWSDYALTAPLLCVRRDGDDWTPPAGVTFRDWIGGALPVPPTTDDLDYHLSTLFPPVRPRGYLEIRYLDAQPGGEWIAPVALLTALFSDEIALDLAREACEPVSHRWRTAARHGLADPGLARAATTVLDVALAALTTTDLAPETRDEIGRTVERRLAVAGKTGERGRS